MKEGCSGSASRAGLTVHYSKAKTSMHSDNSFLADTKKNSAKSSLSLKLTVSKLPTQTTSGEQRFARFLHLNS
jgi:hypothetical protein